VWHGSSWATDWNYAKGLAPCERLAAPICRQRRISPALRGPQASVTGTGHADPDETSDESRATLTLAWSL
jgi:hypothetical protein